MRCGRMPGVTGVACLIIAVSVRVVRCDEGQARTPANAVTRALAFLETDAAKWREKRKCATCHHGAMTTWAMSEAAARGYAVDADKLAGIFEWTRTALLEGVDKPRKPDTDSDFVKLGGLYLAAMTESTPGPHALEAGDLARLADHVVRYQENDGSWESPQVGNGRPPVFESSEVMTLWALAALEPHLVTELVEEAGTNDAEESWEKGGAWLNGIKPGDTTQVLALRLLLAQRLGDAKEISKKAKALLNRQGADGGWMPAIDLPSDAFATGQALYVLGLAAVPGSETALERGVEYLVTTQRVDGSWPMTSRGHPGQKPSQLLTPITHFGTTWAVLGLVRTSSNR